MFRSKTRRNFRTCLSCCIVISCAVLSEPAAAQWDAPTIYYSGATGTGQTLKNQLTAIMSSGHIQGRYGDFRYSAAIHDQDPNDSANIILVYDGASVDGTWNSGSTWNREHIWPQSRQPGSVSNSSRGNLGDPHSLRPANPSINSSRGNKPFGFFDTIGQYRSIGEYWFPGDTDKGEVARSLFYSDTRWTSLGISLTDDFPVGNQMGGLSSLIAWHYLDPPDEFELRRNHTIYSSSYNPQYFTANRSAFVDHPEFVWSVYVDQQNDSTISINGGSPEGDGKSSLSLDFGSVIVGSDFSANQLVTLDKNGLDGTFYSVQEFENAISTVNGVYNSFRTDTTDSRTFEVGLHFDPNLPGVTTGLIVVDNLDITTDGGAGRGSNDGDDFIDLSITVLDHANASFSRKNDQDFLAIDLGRVNPGDQIPQFNFEIHNLPAPFGEELTASLDLVSIDIIPAESSLSISGPAFENLAAGESVQFAISGVADELGTFTTNFVILLFDEDLPGAMSETIELSVSYEVVVKNIGTDNSCDGNAQYFDAVGCAR